MLRNLVIILGLSPIFAAGVLHAADANETKLREQLRAVMLQLRTSETDKATALAAQAEADAKNKELTAAIEKMTKQANDVKVANDGAIAELTKRMETLEANNAGLAASLEKWKVSHKKVEDIANATEAKRAKLEGENIVLKRRVADQQLKNAEMFKIGNEVLTRLEKFGLGEALTAREPFAGVSRVKLQNLMQDYGDKLTDAKIKP